MKHPFDKKAIEAAWAAWRVCSGDAIEHALAAAWASLVERAGPDGNIQFAQCLKPLTNHFPIGVL